MHTPEMTAAQCRRSSGSISHFTRPQLLSRPVCRADWLSGCLQTITLTSMSACRLYSATTYRRTWQLWHPFRGALSQAHESYVCGTPCFAHAAVRHANYNSIERSLRRSLRQAVAPAPWQMCVVFALGPCSSSQPGGTQWLLLWWRVLLVAQWLLVLLQPDLC
jgi:hypothetical protein